MDQLVKEVLDLVRQSRRKVAVTVNTELTLLYWQVGQQIKQSLLQDARAAYGKKVIETLSANLTAEFGKGWSVKQIHHCLTFSEVFAENTILSAVRRNLSWTHFKLLMYEENELKRQFYLEMSIHNQWSTRELDAQIDKMLYERTAIASKPEEHIEAELTQLQKQETISPDLVFKSTYVLDFLGLSGSYSEADVENAIITHIQAFIMEMGKGFAFVERQKRISVDGIDYHLDLLFYHRKLRSLVAIDLKLGKFKPRHKDQNEIRVAQYLTELPSKEWFIDKLQRAIAIAKTNAE